MAETFSFEEAFKKPSETFSFEDAFKPEEGLLRQSADIPVGFVKGAVGATRSVADIFGTQNVVSQSLRGVEDYVGSLLSAQAQQNQKEVSRIMEEAKDKGVWDQVLAAVEAVKTAPLDLLSQGAGSIAPMLIGGAGARLAGAGVAGTKQVVGGIGTAMGAGATKSAIYDAVKEELGKQGFSPDVAEKAAEQAQSYGENIDQIALGALLGRLSSTTGAESALMPQLMGKISQRLAEKGIGKFTQATLGEAGTEFLQSGQEQIAQNIALQRMGVDVPTFQGAVGAGTLGAIIGGGVGAGASVISRGKPAAAPTEEEPEAKTPVAPETEKAAFEPTTAEPIQRELELAEARERGEIVEPEPAAEEIEGIELDPAVKADIESLFPPDLTEDQIRPLAKSVIENNLSGLPDNIKQQATESVVNEYLKKTKPLVPEVQSRTVYRTGSSGMPTDLTAQDIVDYEREELGNEGVVPVQGIDLSSIPSKDLSWVTFDKKEAQQYESEISNINSREATFRVVAEDGMGGYLIQEMQPAAAPESAAPQAAAPVKAKPAEPSRVRYGFDPVAFQETGTYSLVPVDQGGAVFKTRQEAQQAKKFQANTKLQAIEGGYTLVEKRPEEIRADQIKAERMRNMPVAKGPLDILQFLASKGGLSPNLMPEISTDKNIRLGNRSLFAAKGKGLNESIAAEMAAEAGYITDDENLFDVINDSLKVKPRYSINDMDQVAEARYEDYLQAIEESGDAVGAIESGGAKPGSVEAFGFKDDKQANRVAALISNANNLGIDVYGIEESVAARTEGLPQEQYEAAVAAELERAISQAEQGGLSDFGKVSDVQSEDDLSPFDVAPRISGAVETESDLQALNEEIRDAKIRDYQKLRQSISDIQKRAIDNKAKKLDNEIYRALYRRAEELKAEIDAAKPKRSSPENVMNAARKAFADGAMDQQSFDLFDAMYKKNPQFFNGIRLSIEEGPEGITGQFEPISRIIRLFKSNGAISPGTARHEFTHTMEQMMPEDARQKIVDKWLASLKKAVETDTSDQARKYFTKVSEFLENPTQAKMNEAIAEMPSYEYYQYLTPSEYWAVNAEPLMNAYLGSSWQRFKMSMKGMLQAIKKVFGLNNNSEIYTAFKNAINGERRTTEMLVDYINSNLKIYDTKRRNYAGDAAPDASWNMPPEDTFSRILGGYSKTSWIYKYQDKFIDLKDIQKAINKKISDEQNALQRETLYHKRVANETQKIERKMILPLVKDMLKRKITMEEMNQYLHAKFAEERNKHIAEIRPDMSDGGSGMKTQVARDYLNNIPKERLKDYEAIEKQVRDVVSYFQRKMIDYGLETDTTVKAWNKKFPHYVPLNREDVDFVHTGTGMGQGMSSRGPMSYAATGSTKDVSSILDSVFEMAEKTIVKGEKARVGKSLLALAAANPNPDFWLPIVPEAIKDPVEVMKQLKDLGVAGEDIKNLMAEPKVAVVERIKDPKTKQYRNIVVYRIRPNSKFSDNVLPVRLNGKDAYIFFNPRNDRALRLARTLKNLNIEQLDTLTQQAGKITRFIASMSTQYNPIFGMWNFLRDTQGAAFNLSTTPLKGKQAAVLSDAVKMIPALYKELRAQRRGEETQSEIAEDMRQFAELGGPTGYRDQFIKLEESGRVVERALKDLNAGTLKKTVFAVGGWLSDYNDTLENAIRLAAFRKAKSEDIGMTPDAAASLAKELTVNFNRKGAKTPGLSALYAFFNAAIQGNARLLQTLKGPAGKKIIGGGILLGVVQAMILQAFDIEDDDIPEFTKQRNLVIPIGDGKYAMWPMPLGFNFLPTLGRLITEAVYEPRFEMRKSTGKILEAFTNSFNPLGGGGFMQTISPTIIDPFVAVAQNKDAFGRPISREDRATSPTPGYQRSREQASEFGKTLSEILNYISFGSEFTKGMISPTGDDIDYIAGQYLGGVAREAMRAKEFIQLSASGEPVEPHKVPIAGKIVGDLGAPAAVANKFYGNVTRLAEHENEIKGRVKDRRSPAEYLSKYPEARLFQYANKLENEITKINKTIRELQKMEGREKQVETLKNRKAEMMKRFNERYDAAVK